MIPGAKTFAAFAVATLSSFGIGMSIGWKFVGFPRGYAEGVKQTQIINDALNTVAVDTMRSKQQCEQQVTKVNTEADRQREENRKILIEDRAASQAAFEKMEAATIEAARANSKTQMQIAEARNEMVKIKDVCVNAGVPADFFNVLNRALEAEAATNVAGRDAMP